jgi:hypothetical protein
METLDYIRLAMAAGLIGLVMYAMYKISHTSHTVNTLDTICERIEQHLAAIRGDLAIVRWMTGLLLAMTVTLFCKVSSQ